MKNINSVTILLVVGFYGLITGAVDYQDLYDRFSVICLLLGY